MSVTQPQGQVLNASSPIQLEGQRSGMVVQASLKMERNKKIIRGLGIAEVVIGSLCLVLGAIVTAYSVHARITSYSVLSNNGYNYNSYYSYFRDINIGQAMWCGIWVLIAGCLGVKAGGKRASRCLINTHMGFAIVGAVASGLLFIFDMIRVFQISGYGNTFRLGLVIPTVIGSFVALIILTISASYSCCITCRICCADCCGNDYNEPYTHQNGTQQVVYLANPMQQQQQPVAFPAGSNHTAQYFVLQTAPGTQMSQQTYVPMQQIPGNQMMPQFFPQPQVQQPFVSGTTDTTAAGTTQPHANQLTQPIDQLNGDQVQSKQQEDMNSFTPQPDNTSDFPPVYSQECNQE